MNFIVYHHRDSESQRSINYYVEADHKPTKEEVVKALSLNVGKYDKIEIIQFEPCTLPSKKWQDNHYVLMHENKLVESLDIVYPSSSVVELINTGFQLTEGEQFVPVSSVPNDLKQQIIDAVNKANETNLT